MEIVWTDFAIENLKNIFEYYKEKSNKKVAYKILNQIYNTSNYLKKFPNSGQIEISLERLNQNYRFIVSGKYKIIYKVSDLKIIILDVFDSRQHPSKMIDEKRK